MKKHYWWALGAAAITYYMSDSIQAQLAKFTKKPPATGVGAGAKKAGG
tara:strand:- start:2246 stop:2389 length:144 start_codon:yes stop_codon:yes gene_type:complete